MHVVEPPSAHPRREEPLVGVPLSVVFAEGPQIEAVREGHTATLALEPPFHLSDDDAYLVLPEDIGTEIVEILQDGDLDLLHESLRDGLVVLGALERLGPGRMAIDVELSCRPADVLAAGPPPAATVAVGGGEDPLQRIEQLPHLQCTLVSSLLDDEGLDRVLRRAEYVGASWRVPSGSAKQLPDVDPTHVWSRRTAEGVVIELALFQEHEELVALLRPLRLVAAH